MVFLSRSGVLDVERIIQVELVLSVVGPNSVAGEDVRSRSDDTYDESTSLCILFDFAESLDCPVRCLNNLWPVDSAGLRV